MNFYRNILFVLYLSLGATITNSQELYNSINQISTNANSLNYKLSGNRYLFFSTLKGSAYLQNEWQKGSVLLENGDQYEGISLKLNTLTEELAYFNKNTGDIITLDKFIIKEFKIQ